VLPDARGSRAVHMPYVSWPCATTIGPALLGSNVMDLLCHLQQSRVCAWLPEMRP
jgi:hypothetical protein